MSKGPQNAGARVIAEAAVAVAAVVRGRSADEALSAAQTSPSRAAVRAIALGTLRWYLRLRPAVDALLTRPATLAGEVHSLLATAAHQIEYSRDAPALVVNLAVDATRFLGQPGASGLERRGPRMGAGDEFAWGGSTAPFCAHRGVLQRLRTARMAFSGGDHYNSATLTCAVAQVPVGQSKIAARCCNFRGWRLERTPRD